MISLLGLQQWPDSTLYLLAGFAVCSLMLLGWFTDRILRGSGFGVIINSIFMAAGAFGGLYLFATYCGVPAQQPARIILPFTAICGVAVLAIMAFGRKLTAR
jgi:hypothetical protein